MLQQTQVKTVIPYFYNFLDRFPDLPTLAKTDLEVILKQWEGLGYYARARNLHSASQSVVESHNGNVPDDPVVFKTLPGVGDYICAAVQSIAFNHPLAVVDGNVKRVLSRLFEVDLPVNRSSSYKSFKIKATELLNTSAPGMHNQAMMELGALICTPTTPGCDTCPVQSHCTAFKNKTISQYPIRIRPPKKPTHHIAVGVVQKGKTVLITRRKLDGLLGGLWEFPGGKLNDGEDAATACLREIKEETNIDAEIHTHLTQIRHEYTHFKIKMDVYICQYLSGRVKLSGPIDHNWIRPNQISKFAFPKANLKFVPLILKYLG